jgi:hypothetical protein
VSVPVKSAGKVEILVVGKDVDGNWTVHEGAGVLLGRFPSCQAARRFAERERRSRPSLSIASSAGASPRIQGVLTLASSRKGRIGDVHDR